MFLRRSEQENGWDPFRPWTIFHMVLDFMICLRSIDFSKLRRKRSIQRKVCLFYDGVIPDIVKTLSFVVKCLTSSTLNAGELSVWRARMFWFVYADF